MQAINEPRRLSDITIAMTRRLLRFPSRILARMRRLDDVLDAQVIQPSPGYSSTTSETNSRLHTRIRDTAPMPGPWGFITSGYFFGLFFMAFVLHRVQNMVVPPRQQIGHRHLRERGAVWSTLFRSFFPMDLSSTFSRFIFRIPSLFFLLRSLVLWTFILVQTAGIFLQWSDSVLGQWAAQKSMEDICWSTFLSVCLALFVGSLTSGMEGWNPASNAPFNLFGYAFVLYIYASPITHVHKGKGIASRPDIHVLITMILPLLQLAMTHCLEVRQRWARQRLIPTTICGVLSLIHFHCVFWLFPTSYPLPNIVPNVIESFLLLVTLTTCALNAATQVLLTGALTKPLFGHSAALMPKWEEDYSVVLFRLGTASLEATSVAGYGNEAGGIVRSSLDVRGVQPDKNTVEISRSGMVTVTLGTDDAGRHRQLKRGFANEIKNVRAGTRQTEVWADTLVNVAWYRALGRFVEGMWRFASGSFRMLLAFVRRKPNLQKFAGRRLDIPNLHAIGDVDVDDVDEDPDVYERFLRGEELSEDDEDFELSSQHSLDSPENMSPSISDVEEDSDEAIGANNGSEAITLYADLSQAASTSTSAPLLLAHMTDTSSSPLTRRRYASLVLRSGSAPTTSSGLDSSDWGVFVRQRQEAKRKENGGRDEDGAFAESRRNCVICTVEAREIICWPCRCLALCDDCRENLASRSSASKHLCPCCRTSVEGYSKIYIP